MKSPAKLMFGRNIRDKIPIIYQPIERDEGVADRDKQKKEEGKEYSDARRNPKESDIHIGDEVLVKRMRKMNDLDTAFTPTSHRVVQKNGPDTLVEDLSTNKLYRRNIVHLKKIDNGMELVNESSVSVVPPGPLVNESSVSVVPPGPRRSERNKK